MNFNNKNLHLYIRLFISGLFLFSAFAKLYPTPIYGITKVFEEGQLIPMGFSETLAPYISRFIISVELFIGLAILQKNYLKRLIIPVSIFLLSIFSIHLLIEIVSGNSENCGCFGDLIPMTPIQALLKNIVTIFILIYLYKIVDNNKSEKFSSLTIQLLTLLLLVFAFIPPIKQSKNSEGSFISYVNNVEFRDLNDTKILCFFDAGCDHCMEAARSLNLLSDSLDNFPNVYIIFSDTEESKIPDFFDFVEGNFPYQVIPFADYDTEEIDSYMEILFPNYDNPVIILYDGEKQIRLFDGVGKNEFALEELRSLLEKE